MRRGDSAWLSTAHAGPVLGLVNGDRRPAEGGLQLLASDLVTMDRRDVALTGEGPLAEAPDEVPEVVEVVGGTRSTRVNHPGGSMEAPALTVDAVAAAVLRGGVSEHVQGTADLRMVSQPVF